MIVIDKAYLLGITEKLQHFEVGQLKYILKDSLAGKIYSFTGKMH